MFLHSGASLHGHEFTTHHPHHTHIQRKKQFLRSALPTPILRSSSTGPPTEPRSPPQRFIARRRPVSDFYLQPIADLLEDDDDAPRTAATTPPVVRFKDVDVAETPTIKSPMPEDDLLVYDSDASQASVSTPQRRQRRRRPTVERKTTSFVVALPAPSSVTKKALLKSIRPRLVVQLQQLGTRNRPTPAVDVFPASLIAGPLTTARYAHRYPQLFKAKGELCPRDLILVKAEDYTHDSDDDDDGRREPIAVFSQGRGQDDLGEIVLDDGSVWKCSSDRSNFSFVHVNENGMTFTVRWVKRSLGKRVSSAPGAACSSPPPNGESTDSDYKYAFSIINPLTRRHPVLANMTSQSIQIYNDYTTPSASSNRYPPSRPMSMTMEPTSPREPPMSPRSMDEAPAQRETHSVDEDTKKLIMVTGLWMSLRLGPAQEPIEPAEPSPAALSSEPVMSMPSVTSTSTMPRRLTTSNASTYAQPPPPQRGLRRAMSTGASFLQRRKARESSDTPSGVTVVDLGKTGGVESNRNSVVGTPVTAQPLVEEPAATITPQQKQSRRVSWFRKLTH